MINSTLPTFFKRIRSIFWFVKISRLVLSSYKFSLSWFWTKFTYKLIHFTFRQHYRVKFSMPTTAISICILYCCHLCVYINMHVYNSLLWHYFSYPKVCKSLWKTLSWFVFTYSLESIPGYVLLWFLFCLTYLKFFLKNLVYNKDI